MSANLMTSSTEQTETVANTSAMDTSTDVVPIDSEEKPVNGVEEELTTTENKMGKRKRSTKIPVEQTENIPNGRPKRNLSKREEVPPTELVNGTGKTNKTKVEQTNGDVDDEQERDKNIPVVHDVADVVWVKMGGHPWWPSLVIRDPNDSNGAFTKISGNARAKRMYFVVFYGSTADFAWVPDAAIISYQGVEAFTKYAQETVDKAQTKSQKEQLTERFQLKVTIGRREDWEMAVREADDALKQTSEKRLEDIEPKIQFYTNKVTTTVTTAATTPKGQPGRRSKASVAKTDDVPAPLSRSISSEPSALSALDPADRSLLAEKTFEFKSDDDDSSHEAAPLRKPTSVKIKLSKQTSNDSDSNTPPPAKRPYIRRSVQPDEKQNPAPTTTTTTVFGQTANGSSVSYEQPINQTTPVKSNSTNLTNGTSSGKKRGRPRLNKQPSPSTSEGDNHQSTVEFNSASPTVTTKFITQRKPIIKPQAFMNSSSSSTNNALSGQHDIRTGFLSPFEEQEVLDALDQLGPTKTFEEAEQKAKRRFEHILCLNLNRTHVDIPQEWFYQFLFSHPSLIIKNPQWFSEKNTSDTLNDNDLLNDVQSSSSLAVLKHQLVVLSKLYRNDLQIRSSTSIKKRRSTGGSVGKQKHDDDNQQQQDEELIN